MTWLAALLAGLAAGLLPAYRMGAAAPPAPTGRPEEAVLRRLRGPLAALAGAGAWAFLGGAPGVAAGVVAGVVVWRTLSATESPALARRRLALVRDLPLAVDLLGACLDAGASAEHAVRTVADGLGGPLGEELATVHHRLALGMVPREVWREVGEHEQLGPLGRAIGRAHESGAAIGETVHRLAEELRERDHADVEARARGIEVRAAAPLGLCLLPAFLLLGVVPLVVGVFRATRLFG